MSSPLLALGALGAYQGANIVTNRNLRRRTPNEHSGINFGMDIRNAAEARAKQIAPDSNMDLRVRPYDTTDKTDKQIDPQRAARHFRHPRKDGGEAHIIEINPNAHASVFAHELGHAVAQQTKHGRLLNSIKHVAKENPALSKALVTGAMIGAPFVGAALQEGDDDLTASVAASLAVAAPTLADEALASKNALAIMKDANLPQDVQRVGKARLAGAYLTYLAAPIVLGASGNYLGNQIDEDVAQYDL